MALFALNASRPFGERVAQALGVPLSAHEERDFADGEHKARPLVNVRERDVFVIQSLYGDAAQSVNDKLIRLLFFTGALRDASAGRLTLVTPYLAYMRKDRKTQPRDPVTTRYLAALIESVGTDRLVALDVHNLAAFQNAFRIRTDHLEARRLFAQHFAGRLPADAAVTVVSPDEGGIKRAASFRETLQGALGRPVALGFMEKARAHGRLTTGRLVGEVADRTVIILDDLISTGGTMAAAARAAKELGARTVYAAATHGLFVGDADAVLADDALDGVVVTDSVAPVRLDAARAARKLTVVSAAPLVAEAIRRIHTGDSLVALLMG